MEQLDNLLNYVSYLPILIIGFSLAVCWGNVGSRWFLSLLFTVEVIDIFSAQYSVQWKTHYYGWAILMNGLFFIPSVMRQRLSVYLYSVTKSDFFYKAKSLDFTQQEAALLLVFLTSMIANAISYIEIILYKYDLLQTPYFKLYILDRLQVLLHILTCLAALSFSFGRNKGQSYETAK